MLVGVLIVVSSRVWSLSETALGATNWRGGAVVCLKPCSKGKESGIQRKSRIHQRVQTCERPARDTEDDRWYTTLLTRWVHMGVSQQLFSLSQRLQKCLIPDPDST